MRKLVLLVPSLLFLLTGLLAQKNTITGRVTDEKGITIPNASIKIKGSKAGAIADNDGSFVLNVAAGTKLIVSASGYKEVEVDAADNLVVALVEENKTLSEVVVTAQGIRRRPKELGYSVAKVSNSELTVGRAPQVAAGLSGKVSGLVIINANNSIDPAVKFNLRGYRSMSGNNDALIVIDGLPQPPGSSTMFNLLNPNDVESITVLKGGQAATLYGSQGINGALIITTKRGQKGKMRVSFSSSYNTEKINIMADFQDTYGSGSHYATSFGAAGYKPNYLDRMKDNWRSYENQQFGDAYDGSLRPAGRILEDGSVNMLPYSAIPGIREDIWNTGYTLNNQVSFSGGSDNSTFFFSAENNATEGIVPGDKSNRTGARFSASQEYGNLKIGFSANYVQIRYNRTSFNFYNESINQAAHIPLHEYRDWKTNKFAHPNAYYNDYYTNPYFRLDNDRRRYQDANFNGTFELTYKITPWLSVFNKFSAMNNVRTEKATVGQFFHSQWAKFQAEVPAQWDQGDGSGITRALTDLQGAVADFSNTENLLNNELQLLINKNFEDFNLKGIVGMNGYNRKTKDIAVSSSSIVVPDVYNVSNRRGELGGGEANTEERKYGYYADAQLGWRDMLFVHGTIRHDASSRFYKASREYSQYAYTYAGVDASAVITELIPVLKNNILTYAKIRAGYNKNGNDNIRLYGLDPAFGNAPGFPYGNVVGISVGNILPDADLQPEFVRTLEVGGELQFLNNKINLDISYYTQKSEGQVLQVKIPVSTGYTDLLLNVGQTKNWGYEADLKIQLMKKAKLSWDLVVRGSINENKVIKLYPGVSEFFVSGYSYGGTYVVQDMVYPVLKATSYVRDSLGRIVVSRTTGYPLTTGPLKSFGRVTPKYMLGAGTTVSYAGFTLATNWEYRGGNYMFSDLGRQMTFTGSGKWTENRAPHIFPNSAYLDAASGKYVQNTDVMTREAEYALYADVYRLISENFVAPAWFIKMRDINLSYTFSNNLVSKTKVFSGVTLAIFGRNLVTIKDKANMYADPEFSFTTGNGIGINNTDQTPPVRQLGINLNLNFK
ncbi:MAG TPA: SusC/RagA family TonB-linked outer membrane protein [Flavitalea sp.]|nr:SusC/RagA family TonB-linked outer membrane protein [Flavitalea sp.]